VGTGFYPQHNKEAPVRRLDLAHMGRLPLLFIAFGTILVLSSSSGCGTPNLPGSKSAQPEPLTANPSSNNVRVLLYNGTGTSPHDVTAVEHVLSTLDLKYSTANTSQMEVMTASRLSSYKLLIVPGGNSITIGKNLSHAATAKIHDAVVNDGLHYLGICAGAFFGGYSIYNGLNLTNGVWFNFYADEFKGIHKAAVRISFPNHPKKDMYWQDGPQLSGGGDIISKYPDGTPSMVERKSGKGWVILSGVHPEAPAGWRTGMPFETPLAADLAYAGKLVTSALNGVSLPHY
jgi:Biotin-protein ligase, N terminal